MVIKTCVAALPIKKYLLAGLAPLVVLACLQSANAEVHYNTLSGEETTLSLEKSDQWWTLTVSNKLGKWWQSNLLPLSHPLDNRPPKHLKIEQEANGFAVHAIYPVRDFYEQISLSFEHSAGSHQKDCPLQLTRFRREQRYADSDELRSGLVADYNAGVARILGIEGQPQGTPSLPIRLLHQERSFCKLPSVLEFMPALDIPKVR